MKDYLHVYRLDNENVEGILDGNCCVQPKLDGTNGSVWYDKESDRIKCANRHRELSEDKDNAGFYAWVNSDDPRAVDLRYLCATYPNYIFYGEWLVKTTLGRHYTDRGFYIFDVYDKAVEKYMPYGFWVVLVGLIVRQVRTVRDGLQSDRGAACRDCQEQPLPVAGKHYWRGNCN